MLIEKHPKSTTNAFGFVVIKPQDYSASVVYPLFVFVHGNGDRGTGIDNYANAIPSELKAAVDKFKFLVIAVQYDTPDTNAHIDHALNYASANLMIDLKRIGLGGFSLGGGEITRYVTTSLQNADKFAYVVSVGGLNKLIANGIKNIVDSKLPMLFFHSKGDDRANASNTNNAVSAINAANPVIPAKAILYEGSQHDVTNKVFNTTQYPWPGNEIPDTFWEYALALTKDAPITVPVKAGDVIPIAVAEDFETNVAEINLIGNKSRNYTKAKWEVISVPEGINKYGVNLCAHIDCNNFVLPGEGKYVFNLIVEDSKKKISNKSITVTYSKGGVVEPPVKELDYIDTINHVVHFKDGTHWIAVTGKYDPATKMTTYKSVNGESIVI